MIKFISILGSTGSVGLSTLKIIDKKKKLFRPLIFSANKNFILINKQIKKYKPEIFVIRDQNIYRKISKKYKNSSTKIYKNFAEIKIKKISDITISAIPGIAGLQPTLSMINKSRQVLIANKESIICGWDLIKKAALKKTKIVPVDSEYLQFFNY